MATNALAALQPYSSFDLSKVVAIPTTERNGAVSGYTYGIPKQVDTGRGFATQMTDVTAYVNQLQNYAKTRADYVPSSTVPGVTPQSRTGNSIYGTEGQVYTSPNSKLYNAPTQSDNRIGDPWKATGSNSALLSKADQFAKDYPGYFQVGEDPNNRGNYDRGKLDTNNIQGASDAWVNSLVKYDPKYGYIAPDYVFKQSRADFLNKYGPYLVLAIAGGAIAAGAATGGGAAAGSAGGSAAGSGAGSAAGGTFSGIGAGSTTGSLGLSSAGATGAATGSTVAGGTGLAGGLSTAGSAAAAGFGIPAGGYVGAGVGAGGGLTNLGTMGAPAGATGPGGSLSGNYGAGANQYTSGASQLGNSSGASQGLFSSDTAAPIVEGGPGVPGYNPTPAGSLGSESAGLLGDLLGGGSSGGSLLGALTGGGGSGDWLSTLIGAGLTAYQARELADALEVQDKSTDYSRTSGGHTSFDPSIRALQDTALAKTAENETGVMGYGTQFRTRSDQTLNQYDELYKELQSNSNPFIQARVDPLKASIAQNRGKLERTQGLRGVGGSSFGNDELSKFDFTAGRELGNATSTATQEALNARSGTLGNIGNLNTSTLAGNTQLTNSLNTLNQNRTSIAGDRANLERAGLGLSAASEAQGRLSEQQKQELYGQLLQRLLGGSS